MCVQSNVIITWMEEWLCLMMKRVMRKIVKSHLASWKLHMTKPPLLFSLQTMQTIKVRIDLLTLFYYVDVQPPCWHIWLCAIGRWLTQEIIQILVMRKLLCKAHNSCLRVNQARKGSLCHTSGIHTIVDSGQTRSLSLSLSPFLTPLSLSTESRKPSRCP